MTAAAATVATLAAQTHTVHAVTPWAHNAHTVIVIIIAPCLLACLYVLALELRDHAKRARARARDAAIRRHPSSQPRKETRHQTAA